jgi:hypothetical protein
VFRFIDVSQAMTHVTSAEVSVDGFCICQVGVKQEQVGFKLGVQLIERSAVAYGYVIDLVGGLGSLCGGG